MNQTARKPAALDGEVWHPTIEAATLAAKGRAVVRIGRKQIALFHRPGVPLACNNRCPHEGYPLAQGTLAGCVLTCNWHNWKFDLADGTNLTGFDDVPVYRTLVRDGRVWVALTEPPAELRQKRALDALRAAYDDYDYERIARELARLARAGGDARGAVARAIEWSHDRLEYGMTHAYAAAADWLALHDEADDGTTRLACLAEAIGGIAWDALRHRPYPYPKRARAWHADRFAAAVEAEDEAVAIAYVQGGLRAGLRLADLERPMAAAALRHYADFGHSLIYVQKAVELAARLGKPVELPLALALTRALVYGYREDKLPEFRRYAAARAAWGRAGAAGKGEGEVSGLSVNGALEWTVARSATEAPETIHRALLRAAARNLVRFDVALEGRWTNAVATNVGWLDFSHGLTFGHAVGALARKYPELWPDGLLQMACFVGRNAGYVGPDGAAPIGDRAALWRRARETVLDHGLRDPIFGAHWVKTYCAVSAEAREDAADDVLLAALGRFLAARPKGKHVRRVAQQALAFVAREG